MHDESVYHTPYEFKPERFLPEDQGGCSEPDCAPVIFGYGRRICPGMHLADAGLFIYAARILAVFSIQPLKDASGKPVPPSLEKGPEMIRCVCQWADNRSGRIESRGNDASAIRRTSGALSLRARVRRSTSSRPLSKKSRWAVNSVYSEQHWER